MNIAIQTAGARSKVDIFGSSREQYAPLPKSAVTVDNRAKWRKTLSALGKTAKEYAKGKHKHSSETVARATLAAQHLVDLIHLSTLDSAGKRWILEELVRKHSRDQGSGGAGEDAADSDADG